MSLDIRRIHRLNHLIHIREYEFFVWIYLIMRRSFTRISLIISYYIYMGHSYKVWFLYANQGIWIVLKKKGVRHVGESTHLSLVPIPSWQNNEGNPTRSFLRVVVFGEWSTHRFRKKKKKKQLLLSYLVNSAHRNYNQGLKRSKWLRTVALSKGDTNSTVEMNIKTGA